MLYLILKGYDKKLTKGYETTKTSHYTEHDLEKMARSAAFSDDCDDCGLDSDNFDYSGECETMFNYFKPWKLMLDKIFSGDITEENFHKWIKYFGKSNNYDKGIESFIDSHE